MYVKDDRQKLDHCDIKKTIKELFIYFSCARYQLLSAAVDKGRTMLTKKTR